MEHFEKALRCSVQLVLRSVDSGSPKLLDTIDGVLDVTRPIYAFKREANGEAHKRALKLRSDCEALWCAGWGENKRRVVFLHDRMLTSLQEHGSASQLAFTLHKHSMMYWKNADGPESLPAANLLNSAALESKFRKSDIAVSSKQIQSTKFGDKTIATLFVESLHIESEAVMHDMYACVLAFWSLLPKSVQDSAFSDLSKACRTESMPRASHQYLKTVLRKVGIV